MVKYDDFIKIENMREIYNKIKVNTHHKKKLVHFELAFTSNIINIYEALKSRKYKHGLYNLFLIKEPKYRVIMSENMNDKIVNHLVSFYVLIPCLERKLIETNVATRKGKETKYGINVMKKYLNKIKIIYDNVYVLKCDISKYFYNINHRILLSMVRKDIEDDDIFFLIKEIVESTDKQRVNEKIEKLINNEIQNVLKSNVSNKEDLIGELKRIPYYDYCREI